MGKFQSALFSLEQWFLHSQRILPWRDHPVPYWVWISEIMLQQTQVVTVVPYFQRFIGRFPDVESLARATEDEVLKYWAGLGYYSRARNIHQAAKKIALEWNGEFPQTREGWLSVPGVGPYTAGAILSIAFNLPIPILDGNVERVLSRLRCVGRSRGDSFYKSRLWKISEIFVTAANRLGVQPRFLNQALMELGARICTPKNPKCESCPLLVLCRAHQRGQQLLYPPKKAPKEWVQVEEQVVCLMDSEGRVLVEYGGVGTQWRRGLWDLPRDLPLELKARAKSRETVQTRYVVTRHQVTRQIEVRQWRWSVAEGTSVDVEFLLEQEQGRGRRLRWVSGRDPDVPVGASFVKSIKALSPMG